MKIYSLDMHFFKVIVIDLITRRQIRRRFMIGKGYHQWSVRMLNFPF